MSHTGKPAKVFTFEKVDVYITPNNEKIVEWRLNKGFDFEGTVDPVFFVEWARGGGEWTRLNPAEPVVNMCLFLDEDNYRCGMKNDVFYRVVAYDGVREYTSKPAHTLGALPHRDWLLAREIIRKEYLRLVKTTAGTLGHLLKKRWCGEKCDECTDFDTEEPVSGSICSNCFGTGIRKGYYNAIPFWVDLSGVTSRLDVRPPFALEDTRSRHARAVAYPRLDVFDIWIHGSANRRYLLRKVATGAEMRTIPLIYFPVEFRLLPVTDIAYQIPLEQPLETETPENRAQPDQGWRRGIAYNEGLVN